MDLDMCEGILTPGFGVGKVHGQQREAALSKGFWKSISLTVSSLEAENCLDFKQIQMGANNDEMFKICFNIFVGIGTALIQARLQLSGGENMCPLHIVSIVAAFFFLSPFFFFFKCL